MAAKRYIPRTCSGCGEQKDKKDLLRIVKDPDGTVKIDHTGKAQGRGAYICPDLDCLQRAKKKKNLNRALRKEIPDHTYEHLEKVIRKEQEKMEREKRLYERNSKILSYIGLAKKADILLIGYDKIRLTLSKGKKLLIILSSEHSDNVINTLQFYEAKGKCRVIIMEGCPREELSRSLGSHNIQTVAIDLDSGMSEKILQHVTQGGDAIE